MTEEFPLVSVVTPSYNQAQFLEDTILSVLNQDYPNLEYIIIDGGSTDGSVDIIRKYEDRLAYWVSQRDQGQADAINKGWRRAQGEIVAWLNSDDTYLPGAVSTAVDYLRGQPQVDMVYGYLNTIDESGKVIWTTKPPMHIHLDTLIDRTDLIGQPTVFLRKRVLDQVGMLDASLHYCMDCDLWIRIGMNLTICGIPSVIANFRAQPASKSDQIPLDMIMERYLIAKKYGGRGTTVAGGLLAARWGRFLAGDSGEGSRGWIEQDWAGVPEELSAVLQASRSYITAKAYLHAAVIHSRSGQLPLAIARFSNAVKEDPSILVREQGILSGFLRACARLLKAYSHRFIPIKVNR